MASLIVQLVKNPPAKQETPVQFLGQEDTLEKGKATHFSILAWRIPWTVWSMEGLDTTERLSLSKKDVVFALSCAEVITKPLEWQTWRSTFGLPRRR